MTGTPTPRQRPEDAGLECRVHRGRLVISIGIDTLAYCFVHGPEGDRLCYDEATGDWDRDRVKVTDPALWAKETVRAMLNEAEDGSSPLTRFIDAMHVAALDDGAEGVEIPHLGLVD